MSEYSYLNSITIRGSTSCSSCNNVVSSQNQSYTPLLYLHASAFDMMTPWIPDSYDYVRARARTRDLAKGVRVQKLVMSGYITADHIWTHFEIQEHMILRGCQHAFNWSFFDTLSAMRSNPTLELQVWDPVRDLFCTLLLGLGLAQRFRHLDENLAPFKDIVLRLANEGRICKSLQQAWKQLPADYTQGATLEVLHTASLPMSHQMQVDQDHFRSAKLASIPSSHSSASSDSTASADSQQKQIKHPQGPDTHSRQGSCSCLCEPPLFVGRPVADDWRSPAGSIERVGHTVDMDDELDMEEALDRLINQWARSAMGHT